MKKSFQLLDHIISLVMSVKQINLSLTKIILTGKIPKLLLSNSIFFNYLENNGNDTFLKINETLTNV